jgi:hypothetical protein
MNVNYKCKTFTVEAIEAYITIIIYNCKTVIVQATGDVYSKAVNILLKGFFTSKTGIPNAAYVLKKY